MHLSIPMHNCTTVVEKPKNLGTFKTGFSESLTKVLRLLSVTPSSTGTVSILIFHQDVP